MTSSSDMSAEKARAADWFRTLRDEICADFERLEGEATGPLYADFERGSFEQKETRRAGEGEGDQGGGVMSVMRGRLFEKVGVNISEVYGVLGEPARRSMRARPHMAAVDEDPRFWAAGISLVAHMRSPKVPAVHMNTRMFWTPHAWWFGGGSDLNPMREVEGDTAHFHKALQDACDRHDPAYYEKYKAWADEYFLIRHWNEARGVGGIFYDDLSTGDWEADFAFTQDVGRAFLAAFSPLVELHMNDPWTDEDRAHQLFRRGRYAEFNLVYDRGTQFGLQTGHNPEAVLMSLPPLAAWP